MFSCSSAGDIAVIGLSRSDLGIDVVYAPDFNPALFDCPMPVRKLLGRVADHEGLDLERPRERAACWARLEAAGKATGAGLLVGMTELNAILANWTFTEIKLDELHFCVVATPTSRRALGLKWWPSGGCIDGNPVPR
jgi:hypothetical protein